MEANNMEVNLNEMENVCGCGLWDYVQMKIATEIEKQKIARQSDVHAYSAGSFNGTVKRIFKVIIGD